MKIFSIIFAPLKYLGIGLIYIYKYTFSLVMPSCCIYNPSCSTYTLIAIKRFGIFKGCYLGFKRIWRCRPSFCGGYDPVPDSLNENLKYIV
ncbi:MAG: membrane protein insertion efficiency factor YidD [Clostridia bacterium]|nr:membrane protein insertion efficiency factor YidD [Clostridia bacterium]